VIKEAQWYMRKCGEGTSHVKHKSYSAEYALVFTYYSVCSAALYRYCVPVYNSINKVSRASMLCFWLLGPSAWLLRLLLLLEFLVTLVERTESRLAGAPVALPQHAKLQLIGFPRGASFPAAVLVLAKALRAALESWVAN